MLLLCFAVPMHFGAPICLGLGRRLCTAGSPRKGYIDLDDGYIRGDMMANGYINSVGIDEAVFFLFCCPRGRPHTRWSPPNRPHTTRNISDL